MTKTFKQQTAGKNCLKNRKYQGAKRTAIRSDPEDYVCNAKLRTKKLASYKKCVAKSSTSLESTSKPFSEDFGFKESVKFNDEEASGWWKEDNIYSCYNDYYTPFFDYGALYRLSSYFSDMYVDQD